MNAQTQFRPGTWAEKIYLLGKDVFESSSNRQIAEIVYCANQGIISRERRSVAEKTGWKLPSGRSAADSNADQDPTPAKRKQAGSLPVKIQGFLEGTLDEVPDAWLPEHVYPVIDADEVSWNRFIRRMADLDPAMVESFEKWLGRGATLSRQCAFDEIVETYAQWDRKARAEVLARELLELGFDKNPTAILREIWL